MKAQLVSDLHTEFYADALGFLRSLEFAPGLDFLLVPGDVVVPASQGQEMTHAALAYLSLQARHVIYVAGNHEYYDSTREQAESTLGACMQPNFHWLRNTEETIDGVHFFGGVMWFPYNASNPRYESLLNDFRLIRGFKKWVYEENVVFADAARRTVTPGTVVLSHHVPSYRCVHRQFRGDELNRFFVSEMAPLIEERRPRLWVYGHTHLAHRCQIGGTDVVTNPFGYPHERRAGAEYPCAVFEV
jgi:predicted phosphodiesterase